MNVSYRCQSKRVSSVAAAFNVQVVRILQTNNIIIYDIGDTGGMHRKMFNLIEGDTIKRLTGYYYINLYSPLRVANN